MPTVPTSFLLKLGHQAESFLGKHVASVVYVSLESVG